MQLKELLQALNHCTEIWPNLLTCPVTIDGKPLDMVMALTPEGQGPVTQSSEKVGSIDLSNSGLTAEDYARHF